PMIWLSRSCPSRWPYIPKKTVEPSTAPSVFIIITFLQSLLLFFNPADDAACEQDIFMAVVQTVRDFHSLAGALYFHLECVVTPYILMNVSELEHSTVFDQFVFIVVNECERQYAEVDQILAVDT